MKRFISVLLLLLMAGCSNLQFQWSASYSTDDLIEDLRHAQTDGQAKQPMAEVTK